MTSWTVPNLHAPLFKKDEPRRIDRVIDYFAGRPPAITRATVLSESASAAAASKRRTMNSDEADPVASSSVTATRTGVVEDALPRRSGLAVVHFRADDCSACDGVTLILTQLVHAFAGRLPLTEIDVHSRPGLADRYSIRVTPTILLIRDGAVVDRVVGAATRILLQSLLDARAPRRAAA